MERPSAVGKRKTAVGRVRLFTDSADSLINGRPLEVYFPRAAWRIAIRHPLALLGLDSRFSVHATVRGGGLSAQADAIRHGIARALSVLDPAWRKTLKDAGLLSRDPREKERKKYGQAGARKRFQWTKR